MLVYIYWFSMVSMPAGAGEISTTGQIVEIPYNSNGFRCFFWFSVVSTTKTQTKTTEGGSVESLGGEMGHDPLERLIRGGAMIRWNESLGRVAVVG